MPAATRAAQLAQRAQGDHTGAAGDLRRAVSLYNALPSPRGADWFSLACARAALAGQARFARSGVTAAEAAGAGGRGHGCSAPGRPHGHADPQTFRTEEALDPLRSRSDFQHLMLDLAFPAEPFDRSERP